VAVVVVVVAARLLRVLQSAALPEVRVVVSLFASSRLQNF
jgi:hypothetical protein